MACQDAGAHALYLGLIDERTHVAHNPGSLLLGVSRPVAQASVHHRHNEGQAGRIHCVDEHCLEQGVQRRLGVLVGIGNGQQQGLHQTLHLWIADDTPNLRRDLSH